MRLLSLIGNVLVSLGVSGALSAASAECGIASHYSSGNVTANGERFNPDGLPAAHKQLPFGARVAVLNRRTGRSIVVRINDRGPFVKGRIIDLSKGAARALGGGGLARVCVRVLSYGGATARLSQASVHGKQGLRVRLAVARD